MTQKGPNLDTPLHATMAEVYRDAVDRFFRGDYGVGNIRDIVEQCELPEGFWVEVGQVNGAVWIEINHHRPDTHTGQMGVGSGGRRFIPVTADISDIVRMVFGAFLAYQEHEAREAFKFQGVRVFGPHQDLVALAAYLREKD